MREERREEERERKRKKRREEKKENIHVLLAISVCIYEYDLFHNMLEAIFGIPQKEYFDVENENPDRLQRLGEGRCN